MQARLEDDVPDVFIADYAVAAFSFIVATVIVLVISDLPHSPLLEVLVQLSYEFYASYHQQTRQQKGYKHKSFLLLPDFYFDIAALLCDIIRKFAEQLLRVLVFLKLSNDQ